MSKFFSKLLAVLFLTVSFNGYTQGKINKSIRDISESSTSKSSSTKRASSSADDSSLGFMEEVIFKSILCVSYYSFVGSYSYENHLQSDLTPYPFYNNASGNYSSTIDSLSVAKKMRLDVENSFLFESQNLFGNHLKLKIRPLKFFYLQADYFEIIEFVSINNTQSNLSLFNFNFCYDRLRFEKFNLGWTIGANYVANGVNKVGLSLGLNSDVFLSKLFSIYGSAKWSQINEAPLNEYELKFKYHKNNFFGTMGYEHLKIGTPIYNFLALGVGVYF